MSSNHDRRYEQEVPRLVSQPGPDLVVLQFLPTILLNSQIYVAIWPDISGFIACSFEPDISGFIIIIGHIPNFRSYIANKFFLYSQLKP